MIKIPKIKTNIRIHDTARLGARVSGVLEESTVEDANIDTLKTNITSSTSLLRMVLDKNMGKSLLEMSDDQRDNTSRSALYLNKAYLLHPDKNIREAASAVDEVFGRYGFDLTKMNYTAQSEANKVIFRELKSEELAPQVAILPGMTEVLSQLEADEEKFIADQKEWTDALAKDKLTQTASAHKAELLKLINDQLVSYLRAMMQLNPEAYQEVCSKISVLIEEANDLVKRRQNDEEEVEIEN